MKRTALTKLSALSIGQPWAECILRKGKNVENRQRNCHMRGFFAIHATAKPEQYRFDDCKDIFRIRIQPDDVPYGSVLGFAELVDVITSKQVTRDTKKWFGGKYGLVVRNVIRLKTPIPAKGALGFWKLKGAKLDACLKQLSARQRKMITEKPLSRPSS